MDTVKIETLSNPAAQSAGNVGDKKAGELLNAYEGKAGRHPRDCKCSRCANKPLAKKVALNANPEIDTSFVKQSIESVLKATDSVLTQKIYRTGLKLTNDESLSKELAIDAGMTVAECDTFGSLSARIAQKYQFMGKYFEEGCLVILAIGYLTRVALVFKKLGEYADIRRKIATSAKTEPSTPVN